MDVLIGLNHYLNVIEGTIVRHQNRSYLPAALWTVFGFVLFGPTCSGSRRKNVGCMFTQVQDTSLDEKLDRFWSMDMAGLNEDKKPYTKPERETVKILEESIRLEDGRYCVALPFKQDASPLKSNLAVVKRQLSSIERHLAKREEKKAAY